MTLSFDSPSNPATTIAGCFLALVVILGLFAVPTHAQCPEAYSVEVVFGLPRPPQFGGGYWPMRPQAINNNTEVVGYHSTLGGNIAFKWSPEEGMEILEMPPGTIESQANGISENGVIAGHYDVTGDGLHFLGFIIDDDEFTTIPIPPGGNYSIGLGVNQEMQVAGQWGNNGSGPGVQALLWEDGISIDLNPILMNNSHYANDISEEGIIVGSIGDGGNSVQPYILENETVMQLGLLPNAVSGETYAIAETGMVVGAGGSLNGDGDIFVHAFVWDGANLMDIGALPNDKWSWAFGVNNSNHVVGNSENPSEPSRSFIWADGVMTQIDQLQLIGDPLPASVSGTRDINDAGQICAAGSVQVENGSFEPAMLILTPFFTAADLNQDCAIDNQDLGILLGEWNKISSSADLNADGIVNGIDLGLLLGAWE